MALWISFDGYIINPRLSAAFKRLSLNLPIVLFFFCSCCSCCVAFSVFISCSLICPQLILKEATYFHHISFPGTETTNSNRNQIKKFDKKSRMKERKEYHNSVTLSIIHYLRDACVYLFQLGIVSHYDGRDWKRETRWRVAVAYSSTRSPGFIYPNNIPCLSSSTQMYIH